MLWVFSQELINTECHKSLFSFFLFFPDVNECDTDNGGCEHTCLNFDGRYDCECDNGFLLAADRKSCSGT